MQLSDLWSWMLEGSTDCCRNSVQFLHCWDACALLLTAEIYLAKVKTEDYFKELTKKFRIAGYIHMQVSSHGLAYCSEHSFKLNGMCMLRLISCKTPEKKRDALRTFNATAMRVFHRCMRPLTPITMPLQSCLRLLCTASIHNRNSFHLIQGCNNKTV